MVLPQGIGNGEILPGLVLEESMVHRRQDRALKPVVLLKRDSPTVTEVEDNRGVEECPHLLVDGQL